MTVPPQYPRLNPETYIVGKEQYHTTSKAIPVGFAVVFVLTLPLMVLYGLTTWPTRHQLRKHNPELWSAIHLIVPVCIVLAIALAIVIFILIVKNSSCWIEGGHYVDYRHKDKSPTVRIYYKDIVCWSAQGDNTTIFDRFGKRILLDGTLAFPYLFRYLMENNVPVHMNSPVKTAAFLQERYQKSYAEAVAFLRQDLEKSQ